MRAWAPICGLLFSSSPRKYAADVSTITRSILPPGNVATLISHSARMAWTVNAPAMMLIRPGQFAAGQVVAGDHAIAQVVGVLAGKVDHVSRVEGERADLGFTAVV